MTAALLVLALAVNLVNSPRDTVLVDVLLVPTAAHVIVEAVEADSTLLLPATALHDLLGATFPAPWISLDQLRRAYPTIVVRWSSEMAQVAIWDELAVLPAVRTFYESHRANAFNTMAIPQYSGLLGGLAIDDQRRALLDLGYLYKGRLSLAGRVDDQGAGQWNVSAAPLSRLFIGASGGTGQPAQINGRVQAGPVWISTSYIPQHPIEVAGLVQGGPVAVFASRQFGVLTITPPGQLVVQLARSWVTKRWCAPRYASAVAATSSLKLDAGANSP